MLEQIRLTVVLIGLEVHFLIPSNFCYKLQLPFNLIKINLKTVLSTLYHQNKLNYKFSSLSLICSIKFCLKNFTGSFKQIKFTPSSDKPFPAPDFFLTGLAGHPTNFNKLTWEKKMYNTFHVPLNINKKKPLKKGWKMENITVHRINVF